MLDERLMSLQSVSAVTLSVSLRWINLETKTRYDGDMVTLLMTVTRLSSMLLSV